MSHARKSARVGRVGGQVGEDCRACPARGKLNGEVAGHADFCTRILVSVSLSVSVPWNLSLIAVGRHDKRCFLYLYSPFSLASIRNSIHGNIRCLLSLVQYINKHVNVWMLYIKFRIQVAVIRLNAIVCMREYSKSAM